MHRSEARILTTHTGSLPRPSELTSLYARRARGEPSDEEAIRDAGAAALSWVVPQQVAAGIDIINNGEQQRESFVLYLRHRLTGLGGEGSRLELADLDRYPEFKKSLQRDAIEKDSVSNRAFIPKVVGPITYVDPSAIEQECLDFRTVLSEQSETGVGQFMTAPSPGIVAAIVQNEFYGTDEEYIAAVGEALRTEYEAIVRHGFTLQIDCPDLALERHCAFRHRPLSDFLKFSEAVITTINHALRNIPRDQVRAHVCWGNYEGPHDCDVPLAEILPILRRLNVSGLVLPFANPRHSHEHRYLRTFPLQPDQVIVAGVIDTLTNVVEHPEVVAERIEKVVDAVGDPERVLAGTDCGFDTAAGMGRVARDVVWAKLRTLSEGAQIASQRLF